MRVTVANHKGGVGKTTTTLTLAHILHLAGERVVVVDLDAPTQHKAAGAATAKRRAQGLGIPAYDLDELPPEVEGHVFIDSPPDAADTSLQAALELAEVVIVPTSDSIDDLEVALAFIGEHPGPDYRILLTRVLAQSARTIERLKAGLKGEGWPVLDNHVTLYDAYKVAAAKGTTVAGLDTWQGRRATREYENVLREIRSG